MKKIFFICLILMLMSMTALAALADSATADKVAISAEDAKTLRALISVLVEAGVLTADEQTAVMERISEAESSATPAPPPAAKEKTYPNVKFKVRLQPRFSSVQSDSGQPYLGERDDKAGSDGFALRRARFYILGELNKDVGYMVQYQSDAGAENPNLHVGQVEWKGWKQANLVAGQLQTPFGYQIVLCDANLLTADRAAASCFIPPDKDTGIRIDGKEPIFGDVKYQFFVGNGSGKYKANPRSGYLWMGRLTKKVGDKLTIGANYSCNSNTDFSPYQSRFLKKNSDPYCLLASYTAAEVNENAYSADFQYDNKPLRVRGEYLAADIDAEGMPGIRTDGYYLTAGYMLPYKGMKDKLELIASYQKFDPNKDITDKYDVTSKVVGLNYYIDGVQQMVRLNYIWNDEAKDSVDNNKLILQYQLWWY